MSWEGFKYAPVGGLIERIQRRALRTQRKLLRPVLAEKGFPELALRAEALRKNSRLWCENKIAQFKRIYDDYVRFVTEGAQARATGEAPHLPPAGAMGLSGA